VLPSWTPGSYLIREFARHVVAARATSGGRPVAIAKTAKDTWLAAPCAGPLTVTIDVYAYDLSVRTAYLDPSRGYFNGTSVFLCPEGRAHAPCTVEIVAPRDPSAALARRGRCARAPPSSARTSRSGPPVEIRAHFASMPAARRTTSS
jgi:predicted metalloprotease with PDZ domain